MSIKRITATAAMAAVLAASVFADGGAAVQKKESANVYTDKECMKAFLSYMDERAAFYGMTGTHYASPSGLTQSSFSTPQDGLKLGLVATTRPEALEIWNTPSQDFPVGGPKARTMSVKNAVVSAVARDLAAFYPFLGGKGGSLTYSDHHRAQILLVEVKGKPVVLSLMALGAKNFSNIFKSAKELCDMLADKFDGKTPAEGPNLQLLVAGSGGYAACVVPSAAEAETLKPEELLKRADALSNAPTVSRYPASTSKVMTMLCALDFVTDTKAVSVTVKASDLSGGSGSKFYAGDTLTMHDALRIMMMESSNTLANTIARTVGERILAKKRDETTKVSP